MDVDENMWKTRREDGWLDAVKCPPEYEGLRSVCGALHCEPRVAAVVNGALGERGWKRKAYDSWRGDDGCICFGLNAQGVAEAGVATEVVRKLMEQGLVRFVPGSRRPTKKKEEHNSLLSTSSRFTFTELFAGIGGFRIALQALGGECICSVEIDKEARTTYTRNFPNHSSSKFYEDIRDVEYIPHHNLLTAGFPCQSFSSAGDAKGFDDDTGKLFFEVIRILEQSRPDAFLLENVPNLVHLEDGRVLLTIVSLLQDCGYSVQWRLVQCSALVAQSRKRVFLWGTRTPNVPCMIPELPPLAMARRPVWKDIQHRPSSDPPANFEFLSDYQLSALKRKIRLVEAHKPVRTVMASYRNSHKRHSQFVQEEGGTRLRFMTPREVARAQGFPESFVLDAVGHTFVLY